MNTIERDPKIPAELYEAALGLPRESRANLASALRSSLDEPDDDPEVVAAEWRAEIARRIEEFQAGKVKMLDGRTSAERIRKQVAEFEGQ